jgi:hypothetical protein
MIHNVNYQQSKCAHVGDILGNFHFYFPGCPLDVNIHSEDRVTGHLDTDFLDFFLYIKTNSDMVPKFQIASAPFPPSRPSDLIHPLLSCCFKDQ